jgi:hypothetical protein
MGILNRILGGDKARSQEQATQPDGQPADEQAIARYHYMLKTAPPETIEQAHAEAFARLTPEQRRRVLEQLSAAVPEAERAAAVQGGDNPQALARMATRAEVRQPGTMERTFGRMGGGVGLGGLMAGSFLSTIAGTVIGSMIAQQFFSNTIGFDAPGAASGHESGVDANEDTGDYAADDAGGEIDAGDFGDL